MFVTLYHPGEVELEQDPRNDVTHGESPRSHDHYNDIMQGRPLNIEQGNPPGSHDKRS